MGAGLRGAGRGNLPWYRCGQLYFGASIHSRRFSGRHGISAAAKAALSQQIGFGDEGFWASAEALIALPGGGRALLVSAVEAAFLPDFADGNQTPFTRLRLRIDIPQDGTYVVTHPWGQITYDITGAANKNDINSSFDIGFAAGEVGYQGRLGPLLTWDTFPGDPLLDRLNGNGDPGSDGQADYIGTLDYANPVTGGSEHRVKGSPCGTNYFRIDGPNIGGDGVNSVQTDLFVVTGKLLRASLPTPLSVNQVTYSREAIGNATAGQVNVFAKAPTQADVTVSGGANLPGGEQAMAGDGSGRYFASVPLTPDPDTLPANVTVTANNAAVDPDNLATDIVVPLVDLVTITRAEYDYSTGELTVEAHSSDQLSPPTLTALGDDLTAGALTVTALQVAPPTVTVSSSAGGSATAPVTIIRTAP